MLGEAGVRRVLLLVGYKADMIIERYGKHLPNGLALEYSMGTAEDQTGRRVLNAYDRLDEHFLLMYGDNYWPVPLADMTASYAGSGTAVQATVFSNRQGTAEYGFENNVETAADGSVLRYDKSRQSAGLNGVDIGFFLTRRRALNPAMGGNPSFEEAILADLVARRNVRAWITDTQYYYITSPASLAAFEAHARLAQLRHIGEHSRSV
jgi:D-glycero-D-manno-heptose 1,7-bisphosphate phosphatase